MDVTSQEQFTTAVSSAACAVVLFWAEWHEPCKLLVPVVEQLAKDHSNIAFLKVEAEKMPNLSQQFQIESVPTVVVLKKGKIAETILNASAQSVVPAVQKYAKHVQSPASQPKKEEAAESKEELFKRLEKLVNAAPVMLFMKGEPSGPRCGFSKKMVSLLKSNGIVYGYFDILSDNTVRQGLKEYAKWPTFPQMYVQGKLVGGLDVVRELIEEGELQEMLPTESKKEDLTTRLKSLINSHTVMLFMKGSPGDEKCGFSRQITALLSEAGLKDYGHFDILSDQSVRQALKEYSKWPTYPQLYINGDLVGGLDVVREMQEDGDLADLIPSQ